jgi:CubicO group peptidase (beta-lactamase class C family)
MRSIVAALTCALLVAGLAEQARAQTPPDASWAGAWADHVIGGGVAEGRASAAVVAVVGATGAPFMRGYGLVDGPRSRAVDPARDQFQIASVSKTFTAAALAQLIAAGEIAGLDAPVNSSLTRAQIPDNRGEAITFRDLVTHSAGFEERGYGYFDQGAGAAPASGARLLARLPAYVRPRGQTAVYANFGPILVGAALEDRKGGAPFQTILRDQIFAPLGMTASTLNYDPTGGPDLVTGYAGARKISHAFNAPMFAPTGSVQTTGVDMVAYMEAMLGRRSDVLPPAALDLLQRPAFANDPALDSIAMFWTRSSWGKAQILEHAGGLAGVGAWLILAPEHGIGVFMAWSGGTHPFDYGMLRDSALAAALGPRVYAPLVARAAPPASAAGRYLEERRPRSTPEALFGLDAIKTIRVSPAGLFVGDKGPYLQTAPGVFERDAGAASGRDVIVVRDGVMRTRLGAARKVDGVDDPATQRAALLAAGIVALTGFAGFFWPPTRVRPIAILGAFMPLIGLAALFAPSPSGRSLVELMQAGEVLRFHGLAGVMAIAAIAAAALAVRALAPAAIRGQTVSGRLARGHAAALSLSLATIAVILWVWRIGAPF